MGIRAFPHMVGNAPTIAAGLRSCRWMTDIPSRGHSPRALFFQTITFRPWPDGLLQEQGDEYSRPGGYRLWGDQPRSAGHLPALVNLYRFTGEPCADRGHGGHFRGSAAAA